MKKLGISHFFHIDFTFFLIFNYFQVDYVEKWCIIKPVGLVTLNFQFILTKKGGRKWKSETG